MNTLIEQFKKRWWFICLRFRVRSPEGSISGFSQPLTLAPEQYCDIEECALMWVSVSFLTSRSTEGALNSPISSY